MWYDSVVDTSYKASLLCSLYSCVCVGEGVCCVAYTLFREMTTTAKFEPNSNLPGYNQSVKMSEVGKILLFTMFSRFYESRSVQFVWEWIRYIRDLHTVEYRRGSPGPEFDWAEGFLSLFQKKKPCWNCIHNPEQDSRYVYFYSAVHTLKGFECALQLRDNTCW